MQMTRTKRKELCYTTTQKTLECPKVSINLTWKEGLHKRQVNYFGTVKLTNKQEGNQHQQAFELRQRSLTKADKKHKPKIMPSKGGGGKRKEQTLML